MSTTIEIQGWRNDGPIYTVKSYQAGWRNRRNRWLTEHFGGSPGGRYSEQPSWHIVNLHAYDVLLLNRGHEYDVTVSIDGEEHTAIIDARHGYEDFRLSPGVELIDIAVHEGPAGDPPGTPPEVS